jgi:hypothetical protein
MLGECEYCFPAIYQVAKGNIPASDALTAVMMTPEGEA